jgi:hypothetical protein
MIDDSQVLFQQKFVDNASNFQYNHDIVFSVDSLPNLGHVISYERKKPKVSV